MQPRRGGPSICLFAHSYIRTYAHFACLRLLVDPASRSSQSIAMQCSTSMQASHAFTTPRSAHFWLICTPWPCDRSVCLWPCLHVILTRSCHVMWCDVLVFMFMYMYMCRMDRVDRRDLVECDQWQGFQGDDIGQGIEVGRGNEKLWRLMLGMVLYGHSAFLTN